MESSKLFRNNSSKIFRKGPFTVGELVANELNRERIHRDPDMKGVSKIEIDKLGEEIDKISGGRCIDKNKLDRLLSQRKIGKGVFEGADYGHIKEQLNEEKIGTEDEDCGGKKHNQFNEKDWKNN